MKRVVLVLLLLGCSKSEELVEEQSVICDDFVLSLKLACSPEPDCVYTIWHGDGKTEPTESTVSLERYNYYKSATERREGTDEVCWED